MKFLSPIYKPEEFYIQTTETSRAYKSAQAQLSGLFPDNAPYDKML